MNPLVAPRTLRSAQPADGAAALDEMLDQLASDPTRIDRLFPAAARRTSRGDIGLVDDAGRSVLAEDAVRVELFIAAASALTTDRLQDEVVALYRHGDSDEKRAVVLGLNATGDLLDGSAILGDALRTNDTRLIAAAMGPHANHLDDDTWRQGVLKCLFVGVALSDVHDLDARADEVLADMIARYAHERIAAGRDAPVDVWRVLDRFPRSIALIDLEHEVASEHADRAHAAQRLLATRPTTRQES